MYRHKLCSTLIKENNVYHHDLDEYSNRISAIYNVQEYLMQNSGECNVCKNKIIINMIDREKNNNFISEIISHSKNIKLAPNGIFTCPF